MVNLNFQGTVIGGTSGYQNHSKQLMKGLIDIGVNISYQGGRFPDCEKQLTDQELIAFKQEPFINDNILAISMPHQWALSLPEPHKKFLGYCVWEGTQIPKFWLEYLIDDRLDYIIVPSEHTKTAILNTIHGLAGISLTEATSYLPIFEKIKVVAHGVDHKIFFPQPRTDDGVFRFVTNGGWAQGLNDRKGIQFLMQAFNQEFSFDEPVELFVKINTVYCPPGWDLNKEIEKLELRQGGGKLSINTETIPFDKLNELYRIGDVFVCSTMGEAFGLPMLEAMACGLPVITTRDGGGQSDFVRENVDGLMIESELIEVTWDVLYEGISWRKPSIEDLRKKMRYAYEHQDEMKKMGINALEQSNNYSWEKSAELIKKLLD